MAKKSSIENNKKRIRMVERKRTTKETLKAKFMSKDITPEERQMIVFKMAEMPRNASKVRIRNRCALTGRAHGYYKKFGLSRIKLRDLASKAQLPGVTKASW